MTFDDQQIQEIRQIIRDELSYFIKDKFVFSRGIQFLDGRNCQVGKTTGTKFGIETTQKIAFHNATPVVQAAHITDPDGASALYDQANVQKIVTAVNAILVVIENKGFTAIS